MYYIILSSSIPYSVTEDTTMPQVFHLTLYLSHANCYGHSIILVRITQYTVDTEKIGMTIPSTDLMNMSATKTISFNSHLNIETLK